MYYMYYMCICTMPYICTYSFIMVMLVMYPIQVSLLQSALIRVVIPELATYSYYQQ